MQIAGHLCHSISWKGNFRRVFGISLKRKSVDFKQPDSNANFLKYWIGIALDFPKSAFFPYIKRSFFVIFVLHLFLGKLITDSTSTSSEMWLMNKNRRKLTLIQYKRLAECMVLEYRFSAKNCANFVMEDVLWHFSHFILFWIAITISIKLQMDIKVLSNHIWKDQFKRTCLRFQLLLSTIKWCFVLLFLLFSVFFNWWSNDHICSFYWDS